MSLPLVSSSFFKFLGARVERGTPNRKQDDSVPLCVCTTSLAKTSVSVYLPLFLSLSLLLCLSFSASPSLPHLLCLPISTSLFPPFYLCFPASVSLSLPPYLLSLHLCLSILLYPFLFCPITLTSEILGAQYCRYEGKRPG